MLTIQNLSKSFNSRHIIKNFSYHFPDEGIIALIGANGAGKTTLLKILTSEMPYDSGAIIQKKDKKIGYLPQEPNPNPENTILLECCAGNSLIFDLKKSLQHLEEELEANYSVEILEKYEEASSKFLEFNGYSFENNAKKILLGLGFQEDQLEMHPEELSGGWRMRLEIAKLLVQNLDLLILDEPTNHLDLPSIEWLEEYLKKFKGTVLFVSHDETILNNLPDRILSLEGGVVKEYMGNYDDYLEEKANFQENQAKQVKTLQKKVKQLSKFVERFKAKASLAKQAQNKIKMIEKLNSKIDDCGANYIQPEWNIKIPLVTISGNDVIEFSGQIGYDHKILNKISINMKRGDKIGIIGGNGLGKSTLIKTLIGEIPPISGIVKIGHNVNIGYYSQDQTKNLDEQKSVVDNMQIANPSIGQNKLLKILGSFLFKNDDIHKPVKLLSGGEKSKLSLCSMLIRDLNFLILDEPTNHLDIMSVEILGNSLNAYEGTILFVSHNRRFIDLAADKLLIFEKHRTFFEDTKE